MSEIYANAVDLLRIGIEFFLKEPSYSSRKHAILTLFHAIELFLKERLHQENPVFIYRDIDTKITDEFSTVGIKEILGRLDNIGLGLPKGQREIIQKIQKRRNRIEHHRYDQALEDERIIGNSFAFILFFVEDVLKKELSSDIGGDILRSIRKLVYRRNELDGIAEMRLHDWMKSKWADWDPREQDTADEFDGTLDCPLCRESYLVMGYHETPFCFHCNTSVDAANCEDCGATYLVNDGCRCGCVPANQSRKSSAHDSTTTYLR